MFKEQYAHELRRDPDPNVSPLTGSGSHGSPYDERDAECFVVMLTAVLVHPGMSDPPLDWVSFQGALRCLHGALGAACRGAGEGLTAGADRDHFLKAFELLDRMLFKLDDEPDGDAIAAAVMELRGRIKGPVKAMHLAQLLAQHELTAGAIFNYGNGRLLLEDGTDPRPLKFEELTWDESLFDAELFEENPLQAFLTFLQASNISLLQFFRSVDLDRGGTITREEMETALERLKAPLPAGAPKRIIDAMDGDDSGEVTYLEMVEGYSGAADREKERVDRVAQVREAAAEAEHAARLTAVQAGAGDDGGDAPPMFVTQATEVEGGGEGAGPDGGGGGEEGAADDAQEPGDNPFEGVDWGDTFSGDFLEHPLDNFLAFMDSQNIRVLDLFRAIDRNGGGTITPFEFRHAVKVRRGRPRAARGAGLTAALRSAWGCPSRPRDWTSSSRRWTRVGMARLTTMSGLRRRDGARRGAHRRLPGQVPPGCQGGAATGLAAGHAAVDHVLSRGQQPRFPGDGSGRGDPGRDAAAAENPGHRPHGGRGRSGRPAAVLPLGHSAVGGRVGDPRKKERMQHHPSEKAVHTGMRRCMGTEKMMRLAGAQKKPMPKLSSRKVSG